MMHGPRLLQAGFIAAGVLAAPAPAAEIADPAGDFLSTYAAAGARNGDLDVLRASVTFDGTSFVFSSTQNGPVGTTPTGLYVWGIDRGQGTPRFGVIPSIGSGPYDATGVLFDSVLVLRPNATGVVNDLISGPPGTNLAASSVRIDGNEISAVVPASLLPSRGFGFDQYGFNLWPRDGAVPAGDHQISDFAPDNSTFRATRVTEPASLGLLSLGVAMLLGLGKKNRATQAQPYDASLRQPDRRLIMQRGRASSAALPPNGGTPPPL